MADAHHRREVRLAVVLYGGVSLAVYLNGVVAELVRAVLATSPDPAHREGLGEPGAVYRRAADEGSTRVVIDVLTGSSAGGINAALGAAGLAHGRPVDATGQLWVQLADIDALLADRSGRAARSLLDGDLLLDGVHDTLRSIAEQRHTPAVETLDCYLTATDLTGVPDAVALGGGRVVHERHHRAVFHFALGGPDSTGGHRNDFAPGLEPLLAFACRATAAHPVAFESVRFSDSLERVGAPPPDTGPVDLDRALRRVLRGADDAAPRRWYSDGGDMDNKPFSYTLEPLRRRRATVPVQRHLVFVEPDPKAAPADGDGVTDDGPGWAPHIVRAVNLGRQERIVDDIEAFHRVNRSIERYGSALRVALEALDPVDPVVLADGTRPHLTRWSEATIDELRATPGALAQLAHEDRRVAEVAADLAARLARRADGGTGPDRDRIETAIVRELRSGGPLGHRTHLARLDLGYRLRRLDLIDHVLSLAVTGADAVERWRGSAPPLAPGDVDALQQTRMRLNVLFLDLWSLGRHIVTEPDAAMAERRGANRLGLSLVPLGEPTTPPPSGPEAEAVAAAVRVELDRLAAVAAPWLAQTSRDARAVLRDESIPGWLRPRLSALWVRFDEFDQFLSPLHGEASGELEPIKICRISPVDSRRLLDDHSSPERKLAGRTVANFGGFLSRDARDNDLLWGRLDAAERVIDLLVDDAHRRDRLVDAAHDAVLADHLGLTRPPQQRWQAELTGRLVGGPVDPESPPTPGEVRSAIRSRAADLDPPTGMARDELAALAQRIAPVAAEALVHRPTTGPAAPDARRLGVARRIGRIAGSRLRDDVLGRRPALAATVVLTALVAAALVALFGGRASFGWRAPVAGAVAATGAAAVLGGATLGRWQVGGVRAAGGIIVVAASVVAGVAFGAWPLAVGAVIGIALTLLLPVRLLEASTQKAVARAVEPMISDRNPSGSRGGDAP